MQNPYQINLAEVGHVVTSEGFKIYTMSLPNYGIDMYGNRPPMVIHVHDHATGITTGYDFRYISLKTPYRWNYVSHDEESRLVIEHGCLPSDTDTIHRYIFTYQHWENKNWDSDGKYTPARWSPRGGIDFVLYGRYTVSELNQLVDYLRDKHSNDMERCTGGDWFCAAPGDLTHMEELQMEYGDISFWSIPANCLMDDMLRENHEAYEEGYHY